jgi:hypothetical protein
LEIGFNEGLLKKRPVLYGKGLEVFFLGLSFPESNPLFCPVWKPNKDNFLGLTNKLNQMSKKKKKTKKQITAFPNSLKLGNQKQLATDMIIITDAGQEYLTIAQASTYLDQLLLEDEAVIEQIEELGKIEVITARAVFANYRWTQIITLAEDQTLVDEMITEHEKTAIHLGLAMRDYLEEKDLIVINDSQHAVGEFNGWANLPPDLEIIREEKARIEQESPVVLWGDRRCVKPADQLRLHQATRVFGTDLIDVRDELGLEID